MRSGGPRPHPIFMVSGFPSAHWHERLLSISTAKLREQSENVYENKGRGKKVEELRSREVEEVETHRWGNDGKLCQVPFPPPSSELLSDQKRLPLAKVAGYAEGS